MLRPLLALAAGCAALLPAVDDSVDGGGRRAGFGAFLVRVPLELQAELDLVPGEGLMVLGVRPGSTAAGLGLGPGDVVLELNHRDISSRRDVRAVVRGSEAGDPAVVQTAGPAGTRGTARGEFAERVRRPPGGWNFGFSRLPPPETLRALWEQQTIEGQYRRLADEATLYAKLAVQLDDLRRARLAALATEAPWRLAFACRAPDVAVAAPAGDPPAAAAEGQAPAATPAPWRLRFDLHGPGDR